MAALHRQAGGMGITIRPLVKTDTRAIQGMLAASEAFSEEEVRVALLILAEGIEGGPAGDYPVFGAEMDGLLCGYACIGQTPLTHSTWHLYWICVHPRFQGRGVGQALQSHVESFIQSRGGTRIVIETSGRESYSRTWRFYEAGGYQLCGRIPGYYKPLDDCLFYYKEI